MWHQASGQFECWITGLVDEDQEGVDRCRAMQVKWVGKASEVIGKERQAGPKSKHAEMTGRRTGCR